MLQNQKFTLANMKNGQSGTVIEINGGSGMISRLEALGVRIGVRIIKKSGLFMKGPVIVDVGNTQVAIGYGMASKILVEVVE